MSNTSRINAINLQVSADDKILADKINGTYEQNIASDAKYYLWHGELQTYPSGMNGEPTEFAQKLRASLPETINTLRLPFNELSFNADGSLHPDYEAFLVEATAQGFDLIFVYMGGDAQRIGSGENLSGEEMHVALDENLSDIESAWTSLLDWLDANPDVHDAAIGYELINEPAAYDRGADSAGGTTEALEEFVGLYVFHVEQLSNLIQSRTDGNILVGGWNYSANFQILEDTLLDGVSALDRIREAVGGDLIWSAHLYPGWGGTGVDGTVDDLRSALDAIYSSVIDDELLVTETNALGTGVNSVFADEDGLLHPSYIFARAYEWFAENGVGATWFPGAQAGKSSFVTILLGGPTRYLHQDSLAHALNLFSLDENIAEFSGDDIIQADIGLARLVNESIDGQPRETDVASRIGFAFGYDGNDTITGDNPEGYWRDPDNPIFYISNDFLYGGQGDDVIYGGQADDFLFGQWGNDLLHVTEGTNHLFGGDGDDTLIGGSDIDQLEGGAGHDVFDLSALGDDIIVDFNTSIVEIIDFGGSITDYYELLERSEQIDFDGDGEVDDIRITHSDGSQTHILNLFLEDMAPGDFLLETAGIVDGTSGNDLVSANFVDGQGDQIGDGNDLIYLGAGDDTYIGGRGDDTIFGGAGNDSINGGKGSNILFGGAGDDTLVSGQNSTYINGGNGNDLIRIQANKNNSHIVSGGNGNDVFEIFAVSTTRSSKSEILDFEIGIDTLLIDGTTVDFNNQTPGFDFIETEGSLLINFGDDDSVLLHDVLLPAANGYVDGTLGDDVIDHQYTDRGGEAVSENNDTVYAWAGDDIVFLDRGDDIAFGGEGSDTIYGVKGHNTIYGEAGDDILSTGSHSSTLSGGDGNDILTAYMTKTVAHVLEGGSGQDSFIFTEGRDDRTASSTITDFDLSDDIIQINGTYGLGDIGILQAGNNTLITYNDDETIVLTGVIATDLTDASFIWS